jgi:hypothetical protein
MWQMKFFGSSAVYIILTNNCAFYYEMSKNEYVDQNNNNLIFSHTHTTLLCITVLEFGVVPSYQFPAGQTLLIMPIENIYIARVTDGLILVQFQCCGVVLR